jgi:nitroreductase
MQNLYLACEALGLGCCAVAAFDDDAVNEIIDLDGKEEFVIYLVPPRRDGVYKLTMQKEECRYFAGSFYLLT